MTELQGARVLVIDDHADLVEDLVEILEEEGARVRHASSGDGAIDLAASEFDVALLDVRLPGVTGLELLPKLKNSGDGGQEILLITGNASLEDAMTALELGAYAYLLKPFDPDELIQSVARAWRQARSTREAERLRVALERSESELRTLVDTVQALLLVMDAEGRIVEANQAMVAATGLTREALVGQLWVDACVFPSDRAGVEQTLRHILGTEAPVSHAHRLSAMVGGRPQERWVSWRSAQHRADDGSVRIYASGLDVTEVRELERRAQLSEKLAAVGTLSAGLAHEIRNPLNAASLQLRLVERRSQGLEARERILGPVTLVQEELDRLSRLVREFLLFARPSELDTREVDLCSMCQQVLDLVAPLAEERGVTIAPCLPAGSVRVEADPQKLQQVLLNLVNNAIQAVSDEGEGEVGLEVRADGAGAQIVVRDNGPGIPQEDLPRVFEPFFSTKPAGTGLGMAIVHSLVTLHGGTIQLRIDGGTEVLLTLPGAPPSGVRVGPGRA